MSKYRNIKTEVDGITFASKREANRYCELLMLQRAGYLTNLELQKSFELRVHGVLVCRYVADFVYRDSVGREVVEDAKGVKTALYRIKAKLMIACHGLRVIET